MILIQYGFIGGEFELQIQIQLQIQLGRQRVATVEIWITVPRRVLTTVMLLLVRRWQRFTETTRSSSGSRIVAGVLGQRDARIQVGQKQLGNGVGLQHHHGDANRGHQRQTEQYRGERQLREEGGDRRRRLCARVRKACLLSAAACVRARASLPRASTAPRTASLGVHSTRLCATLLLLLAASCSGQLRARRRSGHASTAVAGQQVGCARLVGWRAGAAMCTAGAASCMSGRAETLTRVRLLATGAAR
mmetsp:Transcript_11280/g.28451  ORF Transcript_11280/g.28451 Transcript_11280/m.28451 type:complete len:248 (+) Transcript_11280:207-950(+)